jgi:zinc protease
MKKPLTATLSNGLRVVLLENHAAPVVSFNLWANVGSVNENDQEAGLCHLIEHMLFKGTGKRPVGQIAKEVEAAGGDMNAYTSFDETVFYINMSSRKLEVGLDILADAATDPTFDNEELTREKEVVVEEISRSEDNPSQMASQDLFGTAFAVHPYHRPIAGNRDTVRNVSREYLLGFYKRWYVAENLIFIGVGDFNANDLLKKIETLYSKIPSGKPPAQSIPPEPAQSGIRVVTRGMDVEGRYLDIGLPVPELTHPDVPALDLLAHILGGGASSRLDQTIKEKKQLVSAIGCYPYTPRYPGVFIIGAVLKDKALSETLASIWTEVEKLKAEPPTVIELSRARENMRASRIYEKQTVERMARKLGYFEGIANDLGFEEEYYRRVTEATPEKIQQIAKKYLHPERLTISFCHPKNETWSDEKIKNALKNISVPKKKEKPQELQSFRLPNGIRLIVRENRNLPLIAVRSASLGGSRFETLKSAGISRLAALLASKGTISRTARELAEETENISGHLDGYAGRNLIGVQGSFLSENMTEGFDLFFDMLLHPSFPEEELRKEKGHIYTALRNEKDSLAGIAMKKFLNALYPHHPYGFPALGTAESIRPLTRESLLRLHQQTIRPDNLVISVVGDVSAEDIRERFTEKLKNWRAKKGRSVSLKVSAPTSPKEIITKRKKLQAHIVYGFLGTTFLHPDRYPLEVLNFILAGQGGRLFLELRDKQGLAYAVSSSTHEGIEPGYFAVYMGTDPVKLDTALAGIKEELAKIGQTLVSEEELDRAKRFIIGNYELDLQRNEAVAGLLAFDEIYGLGREELTRYPERIERVTRQDILRVAKKYLRPEASVLSVIRP